MSDTPFPTPYEDPYAPKPSLFDRFGHRLAAVAVFVATVVLTVISFPPFKTPEFAYALLVPGILWAYRKPGFKLFAATMLGAQVVAWTIILAWLHHVTWAGLLLLGPLVGVWIGVWYLAAWWTMPRMVDRPAFTRMIAMVGLAGLWVIIEWTRTWLLTGFPWLPLSVSQWERSSVLQIASYTGAWGISFVLVAMNIGFSAMTHSLFSGQGGWNFRRPEFLLALFMLMACVSVHVQETHQRGRYAVPLGRVAFVQPYIPQTLKWDPAEGRSILETLERVTMEAAATRPDLILWPEASTPWAVKGQATAQAFVEDLARRANAPLLIGSIGIENVDQPDERWVNGAFVIDPVTGLQNTYYAKRHLVPFGEYVPLRPVLGWLSKIVPVGDADFTAGEGSSPLVIPLRNGPITVGPLICYEDIFPGLARLSVLGGSEVLAVLTNNAWYGEGGAAYQHAAHAVLRAVETRRPVLRCGNGGWSGWIDEFGAVRATVLNEAGTIYFRGTQTVNVTRDVRWATQQSFYVQHGDWFLIPSAIAMVLGYGAIVAGADRGARRTKRSRFTTPAEG